MQGRPADIKTYTTKEAREDWHTMKKIDFLKKYHVSNKKATDALWERVNYPSKWWVKNEKLIEMGGRELVEGVTEYMWEAFASWYFGIPLPAIRRHISLKKPKKQTYTKYRQPWVGLI